MSTHTRSVLIYLAGLVSGGFLTFMILAFIALAANDDISGNKLLFDGPQQEVDAQSLQIIQVLDTGESLATIRESNDFNNFGTVVFVPAREGGSYYDDEIIKIPKGWCIKQIGTYKYQSQSRGQKTVPIIDFFKKSK